LVKLFAERAQRASEKALSELKKLQVENLLALEPEMATGDMQAAILAIGAYGHSFRSPTELRVAELLSSTIVTRLSREFRRCAASEDEEDALRQRFEAGPVGALAWSREQEKTLEWLVGNNENDEEERFLGPAYEQRRGGRLLGTRYVPVTSLDWPAGTPSKWDMCGMLASSLLEGQSGSSNKIMVDHAWKRLHLLATVGARCGPDAGHTPVLMHSDAPKRRTFVCALASWLHDCVLPQPYKTPAEQLAARALDEEASRIGLSPRFHYSMHAMLERAAKACSYTAPGTYVTLEPYAFERAREDAFRVGKYAGTVPKMLPCFEVPLHESGCPRSAERTLLLAPGCTCFRSKKVPAQLGLEEVSVDPQVAVVALFRETKGCPSARMPPSCAGAPLAYPAGALEDALKHPNTARRAPREPNEAELSVQAEYMQLVEDAQLVRNV